MSEHDETDGPVRPLGAMLKVGDIAAGKFRIDEVLGEGGFGCVFRAHHVELPTLEVAIKVLKPLLSQDDRIAARFRREATLIATLRGRHVIRLTDFGKTRSGLLFLVMELVRGQTIHEWIRTTQDRTDTDVARITSEVLMALVEAHEHGIIHRDLKPLNIMLVDQPGEPAPIVKVLDFGIAKLVDTEAGKDTSTLTDTGAFPCSPPYTAPEVFLLEPTPASDLYSLGHTMVEMLEGRPPYYGGNFMAISQRHLAPEPVPLGDNVRASGLANIISRACAKPLESRYATAKEMLAALRAWQTQPSDTERAHGAPAISIAATLSGTTANGEPGSVQVTELDEQADIATLDHNRQNTELAKGVDVGVADTSEDLAGETTSQQTNRRHDEITVGDGVDPAGVAWPKLTGTPVDSVAVEGEPEDYADAEYEDPADGATISDAATSRTVGSGRLILAAVMSVAVAVTVGIGVWRLDTAPDEGTDDFGGTQQDGTEVVPSSNIGSALEAITQANALLGPAVEAPSSVAMLESPIEGVVVLIDGVTEPLGTLPLSGRILPLERPLLLRFDADGFEESTLRIDARGPVKVVVELEAERRRDDRGRRHSRRDNDRRSDPEPEANEPDENPFSNIQLITPP